jgi:Cof subfamily protein (haloacid dehalogenase superfamily)
MAVALPVISGDARQGCVRDQRKPPPATAAQMLKPPPVHPPRLIATDLDGTLLRNDGSVSDFTRRVLQRVTAAGIPLVVVTGRPIRRMREIARSLELSGVAICGNGAVVYDLQRDVILEQTPLSAATARALIVDLRAHLPEIGFAVETGLQITREAAYARHRPLRDANDAENADALELSAQGASKLIAMHPSLPIEAFMQQVQAIIAERASVTHAGAPFVEIAAAGVTKAWALEAHCQRLGIDASTVLAFGDMPNDVPMLEWAGLGVAVANAHRTVLAVANQTTASNEDDGVAVFLERHVCAD